MRIVFAWTTCALIGLNLCGCESFRKLLGISAKKPNVSFESIEVKRYGFKELTLDITLGVENQNSFDLKFSELSYVLKLNSIEVAQGSYLEHIVIKSHTRRPIKVPLVIKTKRALKLLSKGISRNQALLAEWSGDVFFHSPIGKMKIAFGDKKTIKL